MILATLFVLSDNLPSWIQAISAACIVALTFLTLIVLRKYAADTRTIADASASQIENSQMPFLAVVMRPETHDSTGGWGIENQGFGPAIDVSYSSIVAAHADIADAFALKQRLVIRYESLSGAKYCTTVTMTKNVMQTQFAKRRIQPRAVASRPLPG